MNKYLNTGDWGNLLFIDMCLVKITEVYPCSNIFNFSVEEFNECPSKDLISFFWCSVYIFSE